MPLNVSRAQRIAAGHQRSGARAILIARLLLDLNLVPAGTRFAVVFDRHSVDAAGLLIAHEERHALRAATLGLIADKSDDRSVDVQAGDMVDRIEVTINRTAEATLEVEAEAPLLIAVVCVVELTAAGVLELCWSADADAVLTAVANRADRVVITGGAI